MSDSLTDLKRVPHTILEHRLETARKLEENETEAYELLKDKETGEHYLMYHYIHLNVSEGGHKETYYHFMPIGHDDALAIVLGEQGYHYPEQWNRPYLRNSSNDDSYVWFDPSTSESYEYYERLGQLLNDKLTRFKKNGKPDPDAIRSLLQDLDKL
ncbi:hypothetical protein [Paenibacillus residui]|uniref:Uncharacterized protein n=1 Tax=Paenibacillus residui TaxID=629724 RepID=A0ABW3D890_9BACL